MKRMRYRHTWAAAAVLGSLFAGSAFAATVNLPVSSAGPAGSGSNRGFVIRVVQAPEAATVQNNLVRALQQLNGTLVDDAGAPIPDEANTGPETGGAYFRDTINFQLDAELVTVVNAQSESLAEFTPDVFPGIPGVSGSTAKFAVEALGYVELPAGETTFGVCVGTARTDVNDDDAYQVLVGMCPGTSSPRGWASSSAMPRPSCLTRAAKTPGR